MALMFATQLFSCTVSTYAMAVDNDVTLEETFSDKQVIEQFLPPRLESLFIVPEFIQKNILPFPYHFAFQSYLESLDRPPRTV